MFRPVIDTDNPRVVLALSGSVLLIFLLANLFLWLKDASEAKKLTSDLASFQHRHQKSHIRTGHE